MTEKANSFNAEDSSALRTERLKLRKLQNKETKTLQEFKFGTILTQPTQLARLARLARLSQLIGGSLWFEATMSSIAAFTSGTVDHSHPGTKATLKHFGWVHLECLVTSISTLWLFMNRNHVRYLSSKTFRTISRSIEEFVSRLMMCSSLDRNRKSRFAKLMNKLGTVMYSGSRSNRSCGWSHANDKWVMLSKVLSRFRKRSMSWTGRSTVMVRPKPVALLRMSMATSRSTLSIAE